MIGLARWSYSLLLLLLVATLALPLSRPGLPRTAPRNRAPHPWRSRCRRLEKPGRSTGSRNGKLRAGVAVTPPWLLRDPFDQEYYGPTIDLIERIGAELGFRSSTSIQDGTSSSRVFSPTSSIDCSPDVRHRRSA